MPEKIHKQKHLRIGIDLSGKPPDTIYVGAIRLYYLHEDEFIKKFKKQFPDYWERKGKNLKHGELREILNFLDDEEIRIGMIKYTVNDWKLLHSNYPKKGFVNAKMLGILYYSIIRRLALKHSRTDIITCVDTGINITKVHETCQRIAKMQHNEFRFSHSTEKLDPIIKLADYIASANRKLKRYILEEQIHLRLEDKRNIPKYIYKKVYR